MLHRRELICERCGASQYAVGRVVEEAERELSYRWCRKCLDNYGPCAAFPVAQDGSAEPADSGIPAFFGGLAAHLKAEIAGQVVAKQFAVGDLVVYRGSHAEKHGPAQVLEDLGRTVLVRTRRGCVECNWTSLEAAPQGLLDAAAAQLAAAAQPVLVRPVTPVTPVDLLDLTEVEPVVDPIAEFFREEALRMQGLSDQHA